MAIKDVREAMLKKNILIICTSFPPQANVGGLRPAMFSKYLPFFGWNPIIFTRILPEDDAGWKPTMQIDGLPPEKDRLPFIYGKKDEEIFSQNRHFNTLLKHFFCPDLMQPPGLAESMIAKSRELTFPKKIHAVWGTNPDLSAITVAAHLANKFKAPWVADFRDVHEQDNPETFREKLLFKRIALRRRQLVRTSAAVTTVSKHHASILSKSIKKNVYVIQNGFDPSIFYPQPVRKLNKFSIVYMGRILSEWLRNPHPLFAGIDYLLINGLINPKDLELLFYGTEPDVLSNLTSSYTCAKYVHSKPRINYKDVPHILNQSCILLVLTNKGRHGILTTKVFEYLAVKRPVICVPGDDGELTKLIQDSNAGFTCPDAATVSTVIQKWYEEWKKTGTVVSQSVDSVIQFYSRKRQAAHLADILDNISSKNFEKYS